MDQNSIPGFTIIRTVGSGGMAIVYLAEDKKLGRRVAIKVLSDVLSENPNIRKRFFNEARLMSGLNHPNIVVLHDFIEFNRRLALVMEYVDGMGLDRTIGEDVGPIPFEKALPLFRQILDATGYAHEKGIIHRDLKPSNILVSTRNVAKLTDFGIAKITGEEGLTRTGTKLGTLCYMSPEQVLGATADHRADIYALGVTLYEMLSGRMPLHDHTTSDLHIMNAIVKADFPDPREYYPHIPAWLVKIVFKAVSKEADKRFNSCEEFLEALEKGKSKRVSIPVGEKSEETETKADDITSVLSSTQTHSTVVPKQRKKFPGLLLKLLPIGLVAALTVIFLPGMLDGDSEQASAAADDSSLLLLNSSPRLSIYDSIPCGPYFQKIDQVVCLSDGRIAVWDVRRREIATFSSTGDYESVTGIDWEYVSNQPLAVISDGGVAVSGSNDDEGGMLLYDGALNIVGTVDSYGTASPFAIVGNGRGIIAGCDLQIDLHVDSAGYRVVCWLETDGEFFPSDVPVYSFVQEIENDEWLPHIGRIPLISLSADKQVYFTIPTPGSQTVYGYDIRSSNHFLQLDIGNPIHPKPREDMQQEIELISRLTGGARTDFEPDSLMPAISSLGVDAQGRIWLQQGIPDSLLFDIYNTDGELLLTVSPELPASADWKVSVQPFGIVAYSEDIEDMQKVYMMNLTGYPPLIPDDSIE